MRALARLTLVAAALAAVLGLVGACGDDSGDDTSPTAKPGASTTASPPARGTPNVTPSTGGQAGGPSPVLPFPASKYAPGESDLGGGWLANSQDTLPLNLELFGVFGPFVNSKQGQDKGKEWAFQEGFSVGYDPDGLLSAVVQGSFYITVQTYLFANADGAALAYRQFESFYKSTPGIEQQQVKGLGQNASGWQAVQGKLGSSGIDAVYHRFVYQRGNMVAQVETLGGLPFMTIDFAREVALIIDGRALGERPAPIPTPSGLPTPVGGSRP